MGEVKAPAAVKRPAKTTLGMFSVSLRAAVKTFCYTRAAVRFDFLTSVHDVGTGK